MKQNELRIGNLVYKLDDIKLLEEPIGKTYEPVIITHFNGNNISVMSINTGEFSSVTINDLSPIPLEKYKHHVKWIKDNNRYHFIQDSNINYCTVRNDWKVGYEKIRPAIFTSLHQLQNLYFILEGHEFDIKKESETRVTNFTGRRP